MRARFDWRSTTIVPKAITAMLTANFELEETDVYRCDGPVNIIRAGTDL